MLHAGKIQEPEMFEFIAFFFLISATRQGGWLNDCFSNVDLKYLYFFTGENCENKFLFVIVNAPLKQRVIS